jgi:hypothetical protein
MDFTWLFPMAIASADLDGDGNLDLVVGNYDSEDLSVFLGNGDGTLQPGVRFATTMMPTALVIGDFNGDGRPDVACAADLPLVLINHSCQ